jgi:hypothetical protein
MASTACYGDSLTFYCFFLLMLTQVEFAVFCYIMTVQNTADVL